MNFLFPLYMLGVLALAIPILLHLRRRPPKDRVVFSSLMFLDPHTPQRKRRSQLENLLLLALRCLALLLLALLFSRPFFRNPDALAEMTSGTVHILLVDRSASMMREGMWDAARAKAEGVLAKTDPQDRVAVLAFDGQVESLVSFGEWSQFAPSERRAMSRTALADSEPSWQATALDLALTEAVGLIEDETQDQLAQREIILISDFQEGATVTLLDNFAWPEGIELRLIQIEPKSEESAAAHLVAQLETEEGEENPEVLARAQAKRVRVTNGPGSRTEKFELAWEGAPEQAVEILLPPGATRVVSAPPRPESKGRFLELTGDGDPFDNRVYVAPTQARPVEVLYLGESTNEGSTDNPLFYLRRAFSPTESLAPQVVAKLGSDFSRQDVLKADVIVVAADLPGERGKWVRDFAEQGGVVLLPLLQDEVPVILEDTGLEVGEADVADYALLEGIDFEHPVLRPFAGAALRDFSKIHHWKYRELTLPEVKEGEEEPATTFRTLARFDSGKPAWLEARVGKGRVYVFASSWVPRDSQLALSSKFVPLIYSILQVAGFESDARRQFYVGDTLPNPGEAYTLILPDGREQSDSLFAEIPGVYEVRSAGESFTYAVNVPVSESRLEPMDSDRFTTLGITLAEEGAVAKAELSEDDRIRLENAELEAQQKVWKWLVLVAVVLLLCETWFANRGRVAEPQPSGA